MFGELAKKLNNKQVLLETLAPLHYEELRTACAEDREIWDIYPNSLRGDHFDKAIAD